MDAQNNTRFRENGDVMSEDASQDVQQKPTTAALQDRKMPPRPDPTRFGDWERGGRCIDF